MQLHGKATADFQEILKCTVIEGIELSRMIMRMADILSGCIPGCFLALEAKAESLNGGLEGYLRPPRSSDGPKSSQG